MKAKAFCMIPHSKKDGIEIEMKPLVLCEDGRMRNRGSDYCEIEKLHPINKNKEAKPIYESLQGLK